MPKKYRKKPIVVEALQVNFGYTNVSEVSDFVGDSFVDTLSGRVPYAGGRFPYIKTLEGDMSISDGDYIIKGIQGEFYPCKQDIFESTYSLASESVSDYRIKKGLIHSMCIIYGFSVEEARKATENKMTLEIILSNLETRATGHLKAVKFDNHVHIQSNEVDINEIVKGFSKKLEEKLQKTL